MSDDTTPSTPSSGSSVPETPQTESPQDITIEENRRSFFERFSIIWVIPILALAIAIGVAWENMAKRGPTIDITFSTAEGIEPGKTELRYRDVVVGLVEGMTFTDNLQRVRVSVRLHKDIADYVDSSAQFWVVRPQVSARGVSGLGTVLTGVFIQGMWNEQKGGLQTSFVGMPQPPLNQEGKPGTTIRLRAAPGTSLTSDTIIEYRGIEVGQLGQAEISDDGSTVAADAIIYSPNDRLITTSTRFWNSSGFTFSLGTGGAKLHFDSLATLVTGGITFGTVSSGGQPIEDGHVFNLFSDESGARSSIYSEDGGTAITFTAYFRENLPGLEVGAPVTYGGLQVGQVTSLNGIVDAERFGDEDMHLAATFSIQPARLGIVSPDDGTPVTDSTATMDYLENQVANAGLRAQLATASIFTGGLKITLVEDDTAAPATIITAGQPDPVFPTAPANVSDVQANVQGVFERINSLPIEDLMHSAINTMDSVSTLLGNSETQAIPSGINDILTSVKTVVSSEAVQGLPAELSTFIDSLQTLVTALNDDKAADQIMQAITDVSDAANAVTAAVADVPALVDQIDKVATNAAAVPLQELSENLDQLIRNIDAVVDTPGARELPDAMTQALDQLRDALEQLQDGGLIENANATLAAAKDAANQIADAANQLPALMDDAQGVMTQASQTLASYDGQSGIGRDLDRTLREVQSAAAAITSLAREIQRHPNSLIFGR